MNLLIKRLTLLLSILTIFSLTVACSDTSEIGLETLPESDRIGASFEQFTAGIESKTILLDSIPTSNTTNFTIGRINDPLLGTIEAIGYFALRPNVQLLTLPDNAIYDSLSLRLGIVYEAGDTAARQTFFVHELIDTINNLGYYNFTTKNFNPIPIDTIRFGLNEANGLVRANLRNLGRKMVAAGSSVLGNDQAFRSAFKGIALVPAQTNNAAVGITLVDGVRMNIFYRTTTDSTVRNLALVVNTENQHFTNYRWNFTRAGIINLRRNRDSIASEETNNQIVLQSGSGLRGLIRLPVLDSIKARLGNRMVVRAILELTPADFVTSPTHRGLTAWINYNDGLLVSNRAERVYMRNDGALFSSWVVGASKDSDALINFFPNTQNKWAMNITSYVRDVIDGKLPNDGIILSPIRQSLPSAVNRTFILNNAASNGEGAMSLKIYYLPAQ